jgi:hypothetical protein
MSEILSFCVLVLVLVSLGIFIEWALHPLGRITKDGFIPGVKSAKKMTEIELKKWIL